MENKNTKVSNNENKTAGNKTNYSKLDAYLFAMSATAAIATRWYNW